MFDDTPYTLMNHLCDFELILNFEHDTTIISCIVIYIIGSFLLYFQIGLDVIFSQHLFFEVDSGPFVENS